MLAAATDRFAKLLRQCYRAGGLKFEFRVGQNKLCRQRLATSAMFFWSCVDHALCRGGGYLFVPNFSCCRYIFTHFFEIKINSSLHSQYYAEAVLRVAGSIFAAYHLSHAALKTAVSNCWRHCVDLTGLEIEPRTSFANSDVLATELTGRLFFSL